MKRCYQVPVPRGRLLVLVKVDVLSLAFCR